MSRGGPLPRALFRTLPGAPGKPRHTQEQIRGPECGILHLIAEADTLHSMTPCMRQRARCRPDGGRTWTSVYLSGLSTSGSLAASLTASQIERNMSLNLNRRL